MTKNILQFQENPIEPGLKLLPFIYSFTIFVNVFSIFFDGPESKHLRIFWFWRIKIQCCVCNQTFNHSINVFLNFAWDTKKLSHKFIRFFRFFKVLYPIFCLDSKTHSNVISTWSTGMSLFLHTCTLALHAHVNVNSLSTTNALKINSKDYLIEGPFHTLFEFSTL